jgi:hypothetical protein
LSHQDQDQLPLLYFIHIGKTAGNTVRDVLAENYESSQLVDEFVTPRTFNEDGSAVLISDERPDTREIVRRATDPEVRCVALNLSRGIHRLLDRPVRYFAILREPVARCVSFWYFAKAMSEHRPWWEDWGRLDFDLERILAGPGGAEFVNNQTRMILGTSERDLPPDALQQAQGAIEAEFDLVGTIDQVGPCIEYIGHRYGWRERDWGRENTGDYSEQLLPDAATDMFAEANQIDAALFAWVRDEYMPRRLAEVV